MPHLWLKSLLLTPVIALVAFFYALVGHAGASGYLSIGLAAGMAPAVIKGQALLLNLVVGSMSAFFFTRAGHLKPRLLLWLLLGSVPGAYLGAQLPVAPQVFRVLVALAMGLAAAKLAFPRQDQARRPVPAGGWLALLGLGLGLLSGLTGVGGGIYLSPVLVLAGWCGLQETAAVSAWFIVVNSLAGLLGARGHALPLPPSAWLSAAAVAGGMGAALGAGALDRRVLRVGLAGVIALAAVKFVL